VTYPAGVPCVLVFIPIQAFVADVSLRSSAQTRMHGRGADLGSLSTARDVCSSSAQFSRSGPLE